MQHYVIVLNQYHTKEYAMAEKQEWLRKLTKQTSRRGIKENAFRSKFQSRMSHEKEWNGPEEKLQGKKKIRKGIGLSSFILIFSKKY